MHSALNGRLRRREPLRLGRESQAIKDAPADRRGRTSPRLGASAIAGLTVSQARIARAHYARLAELHAYSHDHAIASRRYTFAVRCERDYRRAARRCHLLGGFIRANSPLAPASWEASVEPSPEVGVAAPAL